MKKVKILINVIISFILMWSILLSTISYVFSKYTNKEYLISKMEEIEVYRQIYEEVQSGFDEYIYQSGLEINTLKNICDEEKVKNDFLMIIDSVFDNREINIDTSIIRTNLDNEINEYVKSQNRKLTVDEENNIKEFEDLIISSYENTFSVYKNIKKITGNQINNIIEKINLVKNISLITSVAMIVILVIINRKKISTCIGHIGISFLSSGVIFLIVQQFVKSKINIDNLVIFSKAMSNITIYLIKEILDCIKNFGIWFTFIAIFVIIITSIIGIDKKEIKPKENLEEESSN